MEKKSQRVLITELESNHAKLVEIEQSVKSFLATDEPRLVRRGGIVLHLQRGTRPHEGQQYESLDIRYAEASVALHPLGTLFKLFKLVSSLNPHPVTFLRIADSHLLYEVLRNNRWHKAVDAGGLYQFRVA